MNDPQTPESIGPQPPEPEGVSLNKLSQAFAELMSNTEPAGPVGSQPHPEAPVSEALDSEQAQLGEKPPVANADAADAQPCEISPRTILEALLFVGSPDNNPLSSEQIASRLRGVEKQEIEQLVHQLNQAYTEEDCPYHIVSDGPGYRMALREQFLPLRDKMYGRIRQARLSQAAIDVLAIVAYNQPTSRTDVDQLRGKPSGPVLRQLVRRRLLRIDRPEETPRCHLYRTTDRFLDLFGLESLDDIPQSQEMDS